MNDGNLVYVTLPKITKINKYNSIYSGLEGKKGIIYLDSGDYVEVKEQFIPSYLLLCNSHLYY